MAFIRRGKIRQRAAASGYKVVVVVGDDATNNEVNTVDVTIPLEAGKPAPSPSTMTLPFKILKENGNKRFVYTDLTFSEDAVNVSYSMTSTMKDTNNTKVGESLTTIVEVESDGDSRVRTTLIRQLDATNFLLKIVVVGDSEDDVARVDVNITDLIGNAAIPESISMTNPTVNGGKKIYKYNTLTFEDPSGAAEQFYGITIALIDSEGDVIGGEDTEIAVEGLEV